MTPNREGERADREAAEKYAESHDRDCKWLQCPMRLAYGESFLRGIAHARSHPDPRATPDKEALLRVIDEWRWHWREKEPGYESYQGIDANMRHDLAKRLVAAYDTARSADNAELLKELEESARLHGMGGSREAKLLADRDRARAERDELRDLLMRLRESIVFNSKWDTEIGDALGAHAGEGTKGEEGVQVKWVTGTEEYVGKHVVHVGPGVCQTCGAKMREG